MTNNRKNWPKLTWSPERITGQLAGVRHRRGRLIGRMEGLVFSLRNEAVLQTLTEDVLKSNEIEGEKLDRDQVRSSIARRLGLDIGGLLPVDRHVEGVVEMMLLLQDDMVRGVSEMEPRALELETALLRTSWVFFPDNWAKQK